MKIQVYVDLVVCIYIYNCTYYFIESIALRALPILLEKHVLCTNMLVIPEHRAGDA